MMKKEKVEQNKILQKIKLQLLKIFQIKNQKKI